MSRATILVFLTAAVLSHASREEENKKKSDVHISVGPRSFQHSATNEDSEERGTVKSALAQLRENVRAQPAERPSDKALSKEELESQSLGRQISQASSGMARVTKQSDDLVKAVEALTNDNGLDEAAAKGNENKLQEEESEESKSKAKAKLHEVAAEKSRVMAMADDLENQMHRQYQELVNQQAGGAGQPVSSLLQQSGDDVGAQTEEDKQMNLLEKQTEQMVHWFQQMKELKQAGDHMKAQRADAVKDAETHGLSKAEVQKELGESATPPAQKDAKADMAAKKQHLADVLASSAVEMAQIESASNDVMVGLEAFAKWKQREAAGDKSPESLKEAAKVKDKLDKALRYLQDHEGMIDQRSNQINALLKETNMGHL